MWHEDILAWQQVAEAVVTNPSGSPGGFQVVIQDPARVILMISSFSPGAMFLALTPQFVPFGIQLGPDQTTEQNWVIQPGEVAMDFGGAVSGSSTFDAVSGAGTWVADAPTQLLFESSPGGAVQQQNNPRVGPLAMTWRWPRDGLLPKLEWWCYDVIGGQSLYVQSVTMNNRPCPSWRVSNGAGGTRVRLQRGSQSVRGSGHNVNPLAWPESAPPGADILPDES